MKAYKYQGCVFVLMSPDRPGMTPQSVLASAIEEAQSTDPQAIATHLVTTSFKEITDTRLRYNAFTAVMVYLNIDVKKALHTYAAKCYTRSKAKQDAYLRGLAHGLATSAEFIESPWTYGHKFKACLTAAISKLR